MPELELKPIAANTYYIPSPTNVGVYLQGQDAILIDSGSDEGAARQILRVLQNRGLNLRLIINTHSHADHIGGNLFLQKRTGCAVAATREEAVFIENTPLEAAVLYGGYPLAALDNKFLHAKATPVQQIIPASGPILDTGLEALPLYGHSWGMIGVRTPDQVCFMADCLLAAKVIQKYHLFYLWDIQAQLQTFASLRLLPPACYILSHAEPMADLSETVEVNHQKVTEIIQTIRELCATAVETETIFQQLCLKYGIAVNDNGYVLGMSTLRSYLSYMEQVDQLTRRFENGILKWIVP